MLNITGNAAIDVFIGLAFVFFLLSIVCSSIAEGIAAALNLRAKELENGIRNLLGSQEAAKNFYDHWRIQTLFKAGRFLGGVPGLRDKKPSYIPSRVFAQTLLDTVAPPAASGAAPPAGQSGGQAADKPDDDLVVRARSAVDGLPDGRLKGLLQDAVDDAEGERDKLRAALENTFNEAMDRVSGWYKRRAQLILFAIALVVVSALNVDSFALAQRLWKDDALRTAVVAQATKTVQDNQASCTKSDTSADLTPADKAGKCIEEVKQLDLPLGWSNATSPSSWTDAFGKIGGLLITAFALLLGAPFWFDLLGRVARLRTAGNNPADASGTGRSAPSSPKP